MRLIFIFCAFVLSVNGALAQTTKPVFFEQKIVKPTSVKNQAATGTCWCFSTTSLVESECLKNNKQELDISEMYTVRNIYIEKAKNYILRQGKAQFGEGGLGHDLTRAIALYGAVPETVYNGLVNGQTAHNHQKLAGELQQYLDSVLKTRPVPAEWLQNYTAIINKYLGVPPTEFTYEGKKYTPQSFAKNYMKFNANDYVNITSFTHHPYYESFILEAPDNYSNGYYYNLPLGEMTELVKEAINKGYTVMWDADVSNKGFRQKIGLALNLSNAKDYSADGIDPDIQEEAYDAAIRQRLYENLTTQDDHLMHLVGVEKSKGGKTFFVVKNSWGKVGPYEGYINVSEPYFAINTVSLVVPKAALSKELLAKLRITPIP
jgi:bleomycin hydrolase